MDDPTKSPPLEPIATLAIGNSPDDTEPRAPGQPSVATTSEGAGFETYGSFWINQTEFALPAAHVRDVVSFPSKVAQVPLAAPYVVGVFDLRGEVVPIVCLATLLGVEPPNYEAEEARVAIVDCGNDQIGAIFSRTGEVLRVTNDQVRPLHHNESEVNPVVGSVLTLEEGQRIVQVLSAELVAQLEKIPRGEAGQNGGFIEEEINTQRFVLVSVGSMRLALDGDCVIEIQKRLTIQQTIAYFDHCVGAVNLRGQVVPVLDLASALGIEAIGDTDKQRMVFVHDDETVCALLVDGVLDVFEVRDGERQEVPMLRRSSTDGLCCDVVSRVIDRHGPSASVEYVVVLDVPALCGRIGSSRPASEQTGAIGALRPSGEMDAASSDELSFLVFGLASESLALPLASVREIQEFPTERVMRAPGEDERFVGLMPLRGSIVSLIDLRARYEMQGGAPLPATKVLVLDSETSIGLVVDRLDGIVHTDASARLETRSWMLPKPEERKPFHEDLDCVLRLGERSLPALDPSRILSHFQDRPNSRRPDAGQTQGA